MDQLLNVTKIDPALPAQLAKYVVKRRWVSAATKVMVYKQFEQIDYDCKYRRSAIVIQCALRQHLARRRLASLRKQHQIALKLKSWYHKLSIMKSFGGRAEEKITLLHHLLDKPSLPKSQKWLLTWLGPLQRAMYVQKLCRKACVAYMVKCAFLWLHEKVRKKRAQLLLQTQVLTGFLLDSLLNMRVDSCALGQTQTSRTCSQASCSRQLEACHTRYLLLSCSPSNVFAGVRIYSVFLRQFKRVHLERLERCYDTLTSENALLHAQVTAMEEKLASAEQQNTSLETALRNQRLLLEEREARIRLLESQIPKKIQTPPKESLLVCIFRFFTCNTTAYEVEDDDKSGRTVSEVSSTVDITKHYPTPPSSTSSTASSTSLPSPSTAIATKVQVVKPVRRQHEGVWKISRFVF